MLQAVRRCRRCGGAGGERVPPSPLGWYFMNNSTLPRSIRNVCGGRKLIKTSFRVNVSFSSKLNTSDEFSVNSWKGKWHRFISPPGTVFNLNILFVWLTLYLKIFIFRPYPQITTFHCIFRQQFPMKYNILTIFVWHSKKWSFVKFLPRYQFY